MSKKVIKLSEIGTNMEKTLKEKKRTHQQNRALHLYYQLIADALNDAGLDMRAVLKPEVDIPWNKTTVKEYLWRPVQNLQLGKKSTTELTTDEIDKVFETLNRHLAKFGIGEPFPSMEEILRRMDSEGVNLKDE